MEKLIGIEEEAAYLALLLKFWEFLPKGSGMTKNGTTVMKALKEKMEEYGFEIVKVNDNYQKICETSVDKLFML